MADEAVAAPPPPNYKNLTTPQLKAALRASGISFDHVSDRAGLIALCQQHGVTVTNDLKATRERVAAELRRAVAADDADELKAALRRAQQTRGACAAAEIAKGEERLAELEALAAAAEEEAARQRMQDDVKAAVDSADLEEIGRALDAARSGGLHEASLADAEAEQTRLIEVSIQ